MNESKDILEFQGDYRWLSNFWPAEVELDGVIYPSVENAYQAAKLPADQREPFVACTAGQAKRLGRQSVLRMRPDWDDVREPVMGNLIDQKFAPGTPLGDWLVATGAVQIIEGNTWGDTFWGVCRGKGDNRLGKRIMARREFLQEFARHATPKQF